MPSKISRRYALKLIAAATTAATLSPVFHARARYPRPEAETDADPNAWAWMGRAIYRVTFYEEPSRTATRLKALAQDRSFFILGEVRAPFSPHNDVWYETYHGYVHSAWVQPMRIYPPQPFIPNAGADGKWGFWGQVAQVYTAARAEPHPEAREIYRLYGGTIYHVMDSYQDEQGIGWYKIYDDYPPYTPSHQWVLARDIRRVPRAEMSPIHPFAGDKRIEVDLKEQFLTCYEGDKAVFATQVASGMGGEMATPQGEHVVVLKQASRHMSNVSYPGGPPPIGSIFDLPGIPWNTFFDLNGTAIHGTYWHNDFGVRRSHGCVNLSCEAARWIYRWVHPVGGYEDSFIQSDRRVGTPIVIY